eukprot:scaffold283_cov316-Pavlova_lutheri.AAC.32
MANTKPDGKNLERDRMRHVVIQETPSIPLNGASCHKVLDARAGKNAELAFNCNAMPRKDYEHLHSLLVRGHGSRERIFRGVGG